jgi:hypothetical protein
MHPIRKVHVEQHVAILHFNCVRMTDKSVYRIPDFINTEACLYIVSLSANPTRMLMNANAYI